MHYTKCTLLVFRSLSVHAGNNVQLLDDPPFCNNISSWNLDSSQSAHMDYNVGWDVYARMIAMTSNVSHTPNLPSEPNLKASINSWSTLLFCTMSQDP